MLKIINRCTLDINISIIKVTSVSNFANFRIFGQHSKQPEKNHDIKTTGRSKHIFQIENKLFKVHYMEQVMLFSAVIKNASILSVL